MKTENTSNSLRKYCAHYSRPEIQDLWSPPDAALVSIRDPGSERPVFRLDEWNHVLELEFHDVTSDTPMGAAWIGTWNVGNYVPPQRQHATNIARFVRKHWDRTIIVHCEAGLSRSAAVCEVLVSLGWDYRPTRSEGRRLANRRLVQLLSVELAVARNMTPEGR